MAMDASTLHAYARRRLAAEPQSCPVEPADAALMIAWLAALETEAELDQEAVEAALAADRDTRRAEMAAGFRAAGCRLGTRRGSGPTRPRGSPANARPQANDGNRRPGPAGRDEELTDGEQ
jgi:hypothetical protein